MHLRSKGQAETLRFSMAARNGAIPAAAGAVSNPRTQGACLYPRAVLRAPSARRNLARVVRCQASQAAVQAAPQAAAGSLQPAEVNYLTARANQVTTHFSTALGVDDFLQRLERALWGYGFKNDNSIAMVNLCRDEVTHTLKHKIDQVYGSSFSTHGLGGMLTLGVTGVGAGLSHSPVCQISGKERYVFFSFPHIAIDAKGSVGAISRPGRAGTSCACGAVIKCLGEVKKEGLSCNHKQPGEHDPEDVEFSILKQRLARRLLVEGHNDKSVEGLDLVKLTKVTERAISDDLETLISHAVDKKKADYAVVTGVQIHNWGEPFDGKEPNLEFVAPSSIYVVVNGQRFDVDLSRYPRLTPRQIQLLASAPDAHYPSPAEEAEVIVNKAGPSTTVRQIDPPYMYSSRQARRTMKSHLKSYAQLTKEEIAALEADEGGWTLADLDPDFWTAVHL